MKAADVMVRNVITVSPDACVQDVAHILLTSRISGVSGRRAERRTRRHRQRRRSHASRRGRHRPPATVGRVGGVTAMPYGGSWIGRDRN